MQLHATGRHMKRKMTTFMEKIKSRLDRFEKSNYINTAVQSTVFIFLGKTGFLRRPGAVERRADRFPATSL
jgi:hypothetical protein